MIGDDRSTTLRVALYIRYSSEEQRIHSYSAEMQRDQCMEKLAREYPDAHTVVRDFSDLGVSGALGVRDPSVPGKDYRPGLTELLDAIADREVDLVLCYSQDRLARDEYLWHFMNATLFQRLRIPVLFAREDHDILTEEGQMISSFHALAASLERRKISRNVAAAAKRRASEGYVGLPPYGWQWDPAQVKAPRQRRRIVRDDTEGAVVMEIRDRYLSGWPTVEIVRDLHRRGIASPRGDLKWTTSGLLLVLRNPVHAGLVKNNKELYEGQHSALRYWTPEEYDLLQRRITERADRLARGPQVERFLLSGVLYCGHCGRRLIGSTNEHNGRRAYSCSSPRTEGNHAARCSGHEHEPRNCPGVGRLAEDLERAAFNALARLARSTAVQAAAESELEHAIDVADQRIAGELNAIAVELAQVDRSFSRLFDLLDKGTLTEEEFASENDRRREQRENLLKREAELGGELDRRRARRAELDRALALLRDFDQLWERMTNGERRQLLLHVDPHITVRREQDDVVLSIHPTFAEPIEMVLPGHHRHRRQTGPEALTPRQLTVLCLTQDGLSVEQIARKLSIASGTVRWVMQEARTRAGVATNEQLIAVAADRMAQCRTTLPLEGREKRRAKDSPGILTDALRLVLQLLAEGKGCVDIAQALGKDKSTISRQIRSVHSRLAVKTTEEAIARGRELGLLPTTP